MTEPLDLEPIKRRYRYADESDSDVGDLTAWYMADAPALIAEVDRLRESLEEIAGSARSGGSYCADLAADALGMREIAYNRYIYPDDPERVFGDR